MKTTPVLFCLVVGFFAAGALGGCATLQPSPAAPAHGVPELAIWERISFGRNIPRGGEVTEADWARFLAEVVEPRFPGGFAMIRGEGQWRSPSGEIVREQTYFLSLNHADDAKGDRLVEEIIREYKRRFSQEAVFRMRLHVDATVP
ncbi:MAG: DUF3574 domain-containing protein [Opitutaceae bacterium]